MPQLLLQQLVEMQQSRRNYKIFKDTNLWLPVVFFSHSRNPTQEIDKVQDAWKLFHFLILISENKQQGWNMLCWCVVNWLNAQPVEKRGWRMRRKTTATWENKTWPSRMGLFSNGFVSCSAYFCAAPDSPHLRAQQIGAQQCIPPQTAPLLVSSVLHFCVHQSVRLRMLLMCF